MKKTLFIIRGIPGSGKSALGELLAPGVSYAADDYFTESDGTYNFNPAKLPRAHDLCLVNIESAMEHNIERIAVCNTFTRKWEAASYFELAEEHDYSVFIIHCQNDFGSTHNVPEAAIKKMEARWEEDIR